MLIANKLFGPDIGSLKCKTTRRGPPIVDLPISVDTTSILEHYREITLCVDLMYVNKVPLLVTLSRNIKFGTMEAVADRKEATLLKCIKGVVSLYQKAGFKVTVVLMDGEFVPLDRIPSTTPGAEPPRDARDSGSARSHSTHLETSSSNRP